MLRVEYERRKRGLSQPALERLTAEAGHRIPQSVYSAIERGLAATPEQLAALADALEITFADNTVLLRELRIQHEPEEMVFR